MKKRYYFTTPIYYASGNVHIGNSYTTVFCDVLARYFRLNKNEVFYLTGMDEHGLKIEEAAKVKKISPQTLVDSVSEETKVLWEKLKITYDDFIRTTDKRHEKVIQEVFEKMLESGDIYLGTYEGDYCVSCEAFFTKSQLDEDGKCPDCHREVKKVSEESYFFRLSKYEKKLLEHIKKNPDFIYPATRRNEVEKFIESGLKDLCVSRTSFSWGIKVKQNPKHVVYVWLDALFNYLSALGYLTKESSLYEKFYLKGDEIIHVVGKDILRFHAVYWPAFLMAMDVPLKNKIFVHGWILMRGGKMSKSKGNVIYPLEIANEFGLDSLRYYLVKELSGGKDGLFTYKLFIERYNTDLANNFGNLCQRTIKMGLTYFNGKIKLKKDKEDLFSFGEKLNELVKLFHQRMQTYEVSDALECVNLLVSETNRFIDLTMPWSLSKDETKKEELEHVLYMVLEAIKVISFLYEPVLVDSTEKVRKALGVKKLNDKYFKTKEFNLKPLAILFQRIDKRDYEDEFTEEA